MMKRGHDVESAPSIWRWRTAVEHYAGIDVSLELSSVCVVDRSRVPAGARQIDWIAGDSGAAGCAQAASRKVAGRGIEHSGNPARLRPEGRPGDAQNV